MKEIDIFVERYGVHSPDYEVHADTYVRYHRRTGRIVLMTKSREKAFQSMKLNHRVLEPLTQAKRNKPLPRVPAYPGAR